MTHWWSSAHYQYPKAEQGWEGAVLAEYVTLRVELRSARNKISQFWASAHAEWGLFTSHLERGACWTVIWFWATWGLMIKPLAKSPLFMPKQTEGCFAHRGPASRLYCMNIILHLHLSSNVIGPETYMINLFTPTWNSPEVFAIPSAFFTTRLSSCSFSSLYDLFLVSVAALFWIRNILVSFCIKTSI